MNGWKEIAGHFGKNVRTVQRWEKEAGLPVRRLRTGKGETVYALRDELEDWSGTPAAIRETQAAERSADAEPQLEDDTADVTRTPKGGMPDYSVRGAGANSARAPRALRRGAIWLSAGVLTTCAILFLLVSHWRASAGWRPYDWKVDVRSLYVYGPEGRLLWTREFPFRLVPSEYEQRKTHGSSPVIIDDIDGDGRNEVLIITLAEQWQKEMRLYCFNADGSLRFDHHLHRTVQYGDVQYTGPWRAMFVGVANEPGGRKSIWLSSNHQDYFPTVVEKLDGNGRTLGEFWNDGLINVFTPTMRAGHAVMLAGGVNNEFRAAALVVLDAQHPTGTSPATSPGFSCRRGCSGGNPVEYLLFPRSDLGDAKGLNMGLADIRVGEAGDITTVVRHYAPSSEPPSYGDVYYILDDSYRPLHAQIESSFIALHDTLFRRRLLNHPFGPDDEHALGPLLRWTGTAFEPIRPNSSSR